MIAGLMKISWYYRDTDSSKLDERTKNTLEAEAEARAISMSRQGYREGELHSEVDGVTYSGWWSLEREQR